MMAPDLPQRSRDTPEDLTLVQALRATAQLADRRRDQDQGWAELATCAHAALDNLGVDGQAPAGSPGTGHVDRAALPRDPAERMALITALATLERDPDAAHVGPVLDHLRPLAGGER